MTSFGPNPSRVQQILDRIDLGLLNTGDTLDEAELVATYGVSPTPAREAILQPGAVGLLRRLPRKAAALLRPTMEKFFAILEVHAKLKGQTAGLAAGRLSKKRAVTLETAVLACEAHAVHKGDGDPDSSSKLYLRFHECVAMAAGTAVLVDFAKTNARKLLADCRTRYKFAGTVAGSARDLPMLGRILGTPDKDLPWLVAKGDTLIANTDPKFTQHLLDKMSTEEFRMMPLNSPAGAELLFYA